MQYYHSELKFHNHDPLGIICLKNIGSVIPYNRDKNSDRYKFEVCSSSWIKKDKIKSHRIFLFETNSEEEREEWITTIEFLKTVSVHRNFQSSFGVKLKIPLERDIAQQSIFDRNLNFNIGSPSKYISKLDSLSKKKSVNKSIISDCSQFSIKNEKSLREPIKAWFNYSIAHFVGFLMENAIKQDDKRTYKMIPNIIAKNNLIEQIQSEWCSASQFMTSQTSTKYLSTISDDFTINRRISDFAKRNEGKERNRLR